MKKKILCILFIWSMVVTGALATGINVYMDQGAVKNKDGGALTDSDYHPYAAKLEFFHGTLPAPISSAGKLAVDLGTQYSRDDTRTPPRHKYQLATLSGSTLYIRVWSGAAIAPATISNSYYGKDSGTVAVGAAPSEDKFITNLRTNYKCDIPNTPTINSITETMTRTGDTYQLTLAVSANSPEHVAGVDGDREVQAYRIKIKYPDGRPDETQDSGSITLRDAPAGAYEFTPYAGNWYGWTDGTMRAYSTLGAIGGAAGPVTYELKRKPDGIGLNPVAVLHTVPFNVSNSPTDANSKAAVTKIRDLIAAINAKSGANNTVTTFGWMVNSEFRGLYLTYNEAGEMTGTPTVGVTEGLDTPLIRGVSYQIGVHRDVEGGVTFSQ